MSGLRLTMIVAWKELQMNMELPENIKYNGKKNKEAFHPVKISDFFSTD